MEFLKKGRLELGGEYFGKIALYDASTGCNQSMS